jgi:hypothetical protein
MNDKTIKNLYPQDKDYWQQNENPPQRGVLTYGRRSQDAHFYNQGIAMPAFFYIMHTSFVFFEHTAL